MEGAFLPPLRIEDHAKYFEIPWKIISVNDFVQTFITLRHGDYGWSNLRETGYTGTGVQGYTATGVKYESRVYSYQCQI